MIVKKYSWLDDFEAHWPVDDALHEYFNHQSSYHKDHDNGALQWQWAAHREQRDARVDHGSDYSNMGWWGDNGEEPTGDDKDGVCTSGKMKIQN